MRKVLVLGSLTLLALTIGGCTKEETVSSDDIKTHGIYAEIDVTAFSESSVQVRAELKTGGENSNTYVILGNGDKLIATGGSETKDLGASGSDGVYIASFSAGTMDAAYQINFQRPNDTSAPNSVGNLPGPFTIGALPTTKPSRASDALTVTWTPSEGKDDIYLTVEGDCIYKWENKDIHSDPGTFNIPKGELKSTGGDKPTECALKVTVVKIRPGNLDSAFGGGYVHLAQERTATFTSAP